MKIDKNVDAYINFSLVCLLFLQALSWLTICWSKGLQEGQIPPLNSP